MDRRLRLCRRTYDIATSNADITLVLAPGLVSLGRMQQSPARCPVSHDGSHFAPCHPITVALSRIHRGPCSHLPALLPHARTAHHAPPLALPLPSKGPLLLPAPLLESGRSQSGFLTTIRPSNHQTRVSARASQKIANPPRKPSLAISKHRPASCSTRFPSPDEPRLAKSSLTRPVGLLFLTFFSRGPHTPVHPPHTQPPGPWNHPRFEAIFPDFISVSPASKFRTQLLDGSR